MMICQFYVTIDFSDNIQTQLHLQKNILLRPKQMNLIKMKLFHMAVNAAYDLTLIQTSQTQADNRQRPTFSLKQSAVVSKKAFDAKI